MVEQLKLKSAGTHMEWSDTDVLTYNDFTISTSHHYFGMHNMLNLNRFDYFPRSTLEANQELNI